jgi:hypothetical protein
LLRMTSDLDWSKWGKGIFTSDKIRLLFKKSIPGFFA